MQDATFQKMSLKPSTSTGDNIPINNNTKGDDKQPRSGLMTQSTKLLTNASGGGAPPVPTTQTPPVSSTSQQTPQQTGQTKKSEPEKAENLQSTLTSSKLTKEFRSYLRTKLDQNKSDNPDSKKMFEQWLDYVLLCEEMFGLPESQVEDKSKIIIRIGQKFLGKPPDGYNMALKNQLNRKEVINHAKSLSEKVPGLKPDEKLLRDGYEYIYSKLEQKHDLFKKTFNQTTSLQAFLCALL